MRRPFRSDTDDPPPDGHIARRVVVAGRVQGVFFRMSTRQEAARHGVVGWVRNRPDGAVEAHLEGPADAVDVVGAWMAGGGPPMGRVDRSTVDDVAVEGHTAFRVRH